jgi:hypothetical protein
MKSESIFANNYKGSPVMNLWEEGADQLSVMLIRKEDMFRLYRQELLLPTRGEEGAVVSPG